MLWLWFTHSTARDGDLLMQTLVDSAIASLEELTIFSERAWFANGRERCLNLLIVVLSRQKRLRKLYMCGNRLSELQMEQIRTALAFRKRKCEINF